MEFLHQLEGIEMVLCRVFQVFNKADCLGYAVGVPREPLGKDGIQSMQFRRLVRVPIGSFLVSSHCCRSSHIYYIGEGGHIEFPLWRPPQCVVPFAASIKVDDA